MQRSHSAAPSVEDDESKLTPADKTVSSRGCNRLFIVSVLLSALEHLKSATHGRVFPAPPEVVSTWLETAKTYCSAASDTTVYGGPAFNIHDPSTHWSEPQQFLTWWKNFVERKRKQESLLRDASYNGDDERRLQRARFCRHILHLCSLIRRRHQELQQMPDDGLPQPHQQHLGSSDHVILSPPATGAMGVSPRPMIHPAASAKLLPSQPSPSPSMLAYAHIPAAAAPSYAAASPQVHVAPMPHMLPPQAQQPPAAAAIRASSQRHQEPAQRTMATRSSFSPVTLSESSPAPHPQTQPPQTQRAVSASSSVADSNGQCDDPQRPSHASSPAGTCCAGCRKAESPMTTLFDSITSAYDPPEPEQNEHAGRGAAAQKGVPPTSLDRSKSADISQQLGAAARKPSYDFPVRKRRRNRSGSSGTSSCGNMSEPCSDGNQDQAGAGGVASAAPQTESVGPSDASIKAVIAKICNSNDDIWDKFDTLLQEFQKVVQVKQAQIDLLKRLLERSTEDERQAKRRRHAALGTYDLGARYSSVQEMLDAALAESGVQPTPERQSRKVCCSDALCFLCGSSVQAIWTFFCSQGGETLERALVLHAGYTIPEAQAVVRHFENLATAFQQEAASAAARAGQEEATQAEQEEQISAPIVEKSAESAVEELGVNP